MEEITAFWNVMWLALTDKSVCQCLKEPAVLISYLDDGVRKKVKVKAAFLGFIQH
jgi:hypothetical protein